MSGIFLEKHKSKKILPMRNRINVIHQNIRRNRLEVKKNSIQYEREVHMRVGFVEKIFDTD